MKFGAKIYSERDIAEYFKDKADFLEVTTLEGADYGFLKNYPLPIVVHVPHHKMGVNHADLGNRGRNIELFNYARSLADSFHSDKIILHPGVLSNARCSQEEAISAIRALDDRVLIENLPMGHIEAGTLQKFLCTTPEEMKEFLKRTGKGFCFDINHAIDTAIASDFRYMQIINEFLKLNPGYFHIGGQVIGNLPYKEHTSFDDSNIPVREILTMLPENAEVVLEVSTDIKKIEQDLALVRSFSQCPGKSA